MAPTNPSWFSDPKFTKFTVDASALGISPGVLPYASYEARDPWNRELTHLPEAWETIKHGDETVGWKCLVLSPDNTAVELTIFND